MFWKTALTPFYLLMIGFFAFHLWQLWKPTPPRNIEWTGSGDSSGGNGGVGNSTMLEEMERMNRGGNGGAAPGSARINSSGPGGSASVSPWVQGATPTAPPDPTRAGAGEKP